MIETPILLATFAGAATQVAVGIGFSVVAGPMLATVLGAKAAVPVLLLLNLVVSCIGLAGYRREAGVGAVGQSVLSALLGIALGSLTFPHLSETFVAIAMAVMLLGGALSARVSEQRAGWEAVIGLGILSGITTAWTATPGPVMALRLILAGHPGHAVRRLVQPIALVSYGVAFALLGLTVWSTVSSMPRIALLVTAAISGSLLGLAVGPRLPALVVIPAIRIFAALAGVILLIRAASR